MPNISCSASTIGAIAWLHIQVFLSGSKWRACNSSYYPSLSLPAFPFVSFKGIDLSSSPWQENKLCITNWGGGRSFHLLPFHCCSVNCITKGHDITWEHWGSTLSQTSFCRGNPGRGHLCLPRTAWEPEQSILNPIRCERSKAITDVKHSHWRSCFINSQWRNESTVTLRSAPSFKEWHYLGLGKVKILIICEREALWQY